MGAAAVARKPRPAPAARPKPRKPRKPKMTVYRSKSWRGVAAPAGAGAIPQAAGRAAVAVRELPDSGAVLRLTRGRAWIGVLGALLAGIVALNVLSLGLTATSGQTSVQIDALERDNSALRAGIAEKLSATKVQSAAATLGLAVPDASEIGYLTYSSADLGRAAKRLAGQAASAAQDVTASAPVGDTAATTAAPSTPTQTSTVAPSPAPSTPAPSAPPPAAPSSGGGGGVSAGL